MSGAPAHERIRYSEDRRRLEKAASYNVKYEQEFHKRISDRREKRLLQTILAQAGRHERLLDVPCGAGRLSGVLSTCADRVYEVDYSYPMLEYCRSNAKSYVPLLASANVFALPFRDRAFDMVVSIRVSHHIPAHEDRMKHVRELCRVSSRHVLLTFFDENSFKNRIRRARAQLGSKKRPKKTLTVVDVEAAARESGFEIARLWRLFRLFSGHAFTLLHRTATS